MREDVAKLRGGTIWSGTINEGSDVIPHESPDISYIKHNLVHSFIQVVEGYAQQNKRSSLLDSSLAIFAILIGSPQIIHLFLQS